MSKFVSRIILLMLILGVSIISCFFVLPLQPSYAQSKSNESHSQTSPTPNDSENLSPITFGSETYPRIKIIQDFLNVAFSDAIWLEETRKSWEGLLHFNSYRKYRSNIPEKKEVPYRLLSDYIHRPNGLPRHNAIVKWMGPISIGIDWPPFKDWSMQERYGYPEDKQDAYDRFAAQIKILIPDIEKLTGLPVQFFPRTGLSDLKGDFARIRVIPIENTHLINFFRTDKFFLPATGSMNYFQLQYVGAVPFTPQARSQVDGALLPNPDNSLGLAVCEIVQTLPDPMLQAMITECLLRTLGLPEFAVLRDDAVASNWNHPMDYLSKTPSLDGDYAYWSAYFQTNPYPYEMQFMSSFPRHLAAKAKPFTKFTEYDKLLLSLLYCSALKPSMDKYQTIVALLENPSCFPESSHPKEKK